MKHRGGKDHQSDDEGDGHDKKGNVVATHQTLSKEEIERQQLEDVPTIPDSEISPAAYLFQH